MVSYFVSDVNNINSDVVEALQECRKEGVDIRGSVLAKSKQVEQSYEVYRKCVEGSQLSMMSESEALHCALNYCSATFTGGNKFVVPPLEAPAGSAAAAVAASGDVFSNLQSVDVWLAMQLYNADLIE